ncbi:rhodanese-related sulfurtransferase [Vulcanococcus limneticus]|uniref:oxygen-dependent tRNA uridine(34) hydroxylase TrhO n=1 Tax=Vulcanococcus limneticus TaxID=2170428 RepID=UPI00398C0DF5
MTVQVAAFYGFAAMEGLLELQEELKALAAAGTVRGTILLAGEGVNGTISGPPAGVGRVLARLRALPGLTNLEAKLSWAPQPVFHRLKVRLKREIVTMGCPTVKPAEQVGTYVPPEHWDELIRDPDTLVIDTRNAYEVAIGSFEGALDPGTASFREFPTWVEQELRPLVAQRRPKAIAMFCTGGIRCEKATAYLQQQGFAGVHHLQGGILKYLEEVPEQGSSWRGECYVFDRRVSVNHRLEPGIYSLCHACGLPLSPADRALPSYREGVSCRHCIERFSEADRERFAERQRQMERARTRRDVSMGVSPGAVARGGQGA